MSTLDLEALASGRSWQRRALLIAIVLGVAVAGAFVAYRAWWPAGGSSAAPSTLREATVTRGSVAGTLTTNGTAASSLTSRLPFAAGGTVQSVSVKVGDSVKAGQELARINDRDARRRLDSAAANLESAKLRLAQLKEPPTDSDRASAQVAVTNARSQRLNALSALDLATGETPPAQAEIDSASGALAQAAVTLRNATTSLSVAWSVLVAAQTAYCQTRDHFDQTQSQFYFCNPATLPLGTATVSALVDTFVLVAGGPSGTLGTRSTSLIQANASYLTAQTAVDSAQRGRDSAQAKVDALRQFDAMRIALARLAFDSADASLDAANARLQALRSGPTQSTIDLQQQNVRLSEISYQQALDAVNDLVLRAPYDGVMGQVNVVPGDQVGAGTVAVVITNPAAVRVDLTVSESDLPGLAAGQFGIAQFDAMGQQQYVLQISGVSRVPTITQGVVTYPVQAQILTGEALMAQSAQIAQFFSALGGGTARQLGGAAGARAQGEGATPPAQQPGAGARTGRDTQGGAAGGAGGAAATPAAGAAGRGAAGGAAGVGALAAPAVMPAAGMTASVTILLKVEQDVLMVPSAAVRRQRQSSIVIVKAADGSQQQKRVVVGGTDGTNTTILSGLEEGETVLIGALSAPAGASTATASPPAGAPGAPGAPGGFGAPGGPGPGAPGGGGAGGAGGAIR